jgi:hypothetical protein
LDEAAGLLEKTLQEEKNTDPALTELAEATINEQAKVGRIDFDRAHLSRPPGTRPYAAPRCAPVPIVHSKSAAETLMGGVPTGTLALPGTARVTHTPW